MIVLTLYQLIPHEKYDGITSHGFDIAAIRLENSIDFKGPNANVRCVCNTKPMETVIPDECYVIGWGKTLAQNIDQL